MRMATATATVCLNITRSHHHHHQQQQPTLPLPLPKPRQLQLQLHRTIELALCVSRSRVRVLDRASKWRRVADAAIEASLHVRAVDGRLPRTHNQHVPCVRTRMWRSAVGLDYSVHCVAGTT